MENHSVPGAKRRNPLLDPDQPAHPAMLLLVNLDGSLKPEFKDWERGQLQLLDVDPGSLLPVWWPTETDDGLRETLSYEDRMVIFREQLDNLLSLHVHGGDIIKSSRRFLSVTPVEEILSPEVVLNCVRQLHSIFAHYWH